MNSSKEAIIETLNCPCKGFLENMANSAIANPGSIDILIGILVDENSVIQWRAANVLRFVAKLKPDVFSDAQIQSMVDILSLELSDNLAGVLFKLLSYTSFEIENNAHVLDLCLYHIRKESEISYNRAWGIDLLALVVKSYPELKPEIEETFRALELKGQKLYVKNKFKRLLAV